MKIALLGSLNSSQGGDYQTIKQLESKLKENGHETDFHVGSKNNSENLICEKIPVPRETYRFLRYIEYGIRYRNKGQSDYDLIIAQQGSIITGYQLSLKNNIPLAIYLHDGQFLHKKELKGSNIITKSLNFIFSTFNQKIFSKITSRASKIISNSNCIRKQYFNEYEIDSEVVYPLIEKQKYEVEETGEKILHVNPSIHKGIDITLQLAQKFPQQEFIITGPSPNQEIKQKIQAVENIEYLGFVRDMKEVYSQTKLVLMPSKWEEPYGRIPVEAAINGIPTITSGEGGLKEATCNPELILRTNTVEQYQEKIRLVLNNYSKYSLQALMNNSDKLSDSQYIKIDNMLKEELST